MPTPPKPSVTVVIVTRNRWEEAARAVESALTQSVNPDVFVVDDASEDGTAENLIRMFPKLRLHRSERHHGLVAQRSYAAQNCDSDYIVSLDDDAVYDSPSVVSEALAAFSDPRVGAVAIPYKEGADLQIKLDCAKGDGVFVVEYFPGGSSIVDRSLFNALGGYRDFLFYSGEERDYCARMYNAGYVTALSRSGWMFHYPSLVRNRANGVRYTVRNFILYGYLILPFPQSVVQVLGTTLRRTLRGAREGYAAAAISGAVRGHLIGIKHIHERTPLSKKVLSALRIIREGNGVPLLAVQHLLPAPKPFPGVGRSQP